MKALDAGLSELSEWSGVASSVVTDYLGFRYMVGDWNADGKSNLAVRRSNRTLMDFNFDRTAEKEQYYGNGDSEAQYLVGDWDGDGYDNLAVRRGACVLMDVDFDGVLDRETCYGNGSTEDQYLVGDWDGDGDDGLAVRRGACVLMDFNVDGTVDREFCFGLGNAEDQYLVGDWDGNGDDNLAVRRGNCVLMDLDASGGHDREQCFGSGNDEAEYLVGDWNGDRRDDLAVRRSNCIVMSVQAGTQQKQCYGDERLWNEPSVRLVVSPGGTYPREEATEVTLEAVDPVAAVEGFWQVDLSGAARYQKVFGCETGPLDRAESRTCRIRIWVTAGSAAAFGGTSLEKSVVRPAGPNPSVPKGQGAPSGALMAPEDIVSVTLLVRSSKGTSFMTLAALKFPKTDCKRAACQDQK